MGISLERAALEAALTEARSILSEAITTSSYGGKQKKNGQEAKNAAIQSSGPIQKIHAVVAKSIYENLLKEGLDTQVFPPIGSSAPELKVTGLLKAKKQDVSFTVDPHVPEIIRTGVEAGEIDCVGFNATNRALVIGVRSQLSSLAKNFDTLVERSFAETLNLRLRCRGITLGEVYLIPLYEFKDSDLKNNVVGFKSKPVNLLRFVKIFNAITDPNYKHDDQGLYKYNATMLIVADFSKKNVKILWDEADVTKAFSAELANQMKPLLPSGFDQRISSAYLSALQVNQDNVQDIHLEPKD